MSVGPRAFTFHFYKQILDKPKLPSTKIPQHILDRATGKLTDGSPIQFMWQYRKPMIRRRYATFGKDSGIKAGVCWPSRDELQFMKQYEEKFEKPFKEMTAAVKQKQDEEKERIAKRVKEVRENLKKLPQQKEEFWASYHKLFEDIEQEKLQKEKVIQEVREFLGYDIDPSDPRFEEAIAKKDEEEKAAIRAARKLEKQRQNMEALQALVSEALEKEKESKKSGAKPTPSEEKTEQS